MREVAEGGQRFLELDTGEGWAFDKAIFFWPLKPLFICHCVICHAFCMYHQRHIEPNFNQVHLRIQISEKHTKIFNNCFKMSMLFHFVAHSVSTHFKGEMSTYRLPHPTPCRHLGQLELSAFASVSKPFTRPKLPKRSRWELHG